MYVPHLLYPLVIDEYLLISCFHVLIIVNSAEMSIEVHVYFWINFFSEYMLRSGIAGSHGSSISSFTYLFIYFYFYLYFLICSEFCHTLKWKGLGFTCLPHPDPPSHLLPLTYLFLTSLCLCCCVWAFSSCGKWGLLLVVVWELLIAVASLVAEATLGPTSFSSCCWAQYLWPIGLAAPKHVETCWTRDGTHVPCIGWWILHHWAIKEVHGLALEIIHNYFHPILFIRRGFLRLTHTQGKGRFW